MRIFKILTLLLALLPIACFGNGRHIQYAPDADGYLVCHNGKNLYTRALYGSPTLWRLETSDLPIFGAYHKTDNQNIHFEVTCKGRTLRLDSVADCTALYKGGERIYRLSDPSWGNGTITMTVVALPDSEGAIWQIKATSMPKGSTLTANSCATVPVKLSRSGDMGADPANCFAPHPDLCDLSQCTVGISGKDVVKYVVYADRNVSADNQLSLSRTYDAAQQPRINLINRVTIDTPDKYINTLGPTLTTAGDGIWDGETYLHGAVGWRNPLCGWRGAYTGDFLGWHDRARSHFNAYAQSQVVDVPPTIAHPAQDEKMSLARAEKRWGTPMYSNGYICRYPGRNDQMNHYDMNLCYIDELLWHIQWTGDLGYAREVWPTLCRSLEWEKRNFDPDDDGLYDAYCCIWASDALYYNSGAVTHSSAYNYRANKLAALIAEKIGEDPSPYQAEATKILDAINAQLWLDDKGVWAEYRDLMGNRLLHDHPAVWTVYHAIDSDIATPIQAYTATGYINRNIPHIPVNADCLNEASYATISTTDWLPYAWSINNVAFAEVYHTALAFWEAGRSQEAFTLLKSAMLDGMFLGNSPANIGQISYYDAARGETYRDFADPVGVLSRAVVQGLFGFTPDLLNDRVKIRPGWPMSWQYARFSHPDFSIDFRREGSVDTYILDVGLQDVDTLDITLEALRDRVSSVTVNGEAAMWYIDSLSVGRPTIRINVAAQPHNVVEVAWDGSFIAPSRPVPALGTEPVRHMHQGDMIWLVETIVPDTIDYEALSSQLGLRPFVADGCTFEPLDLTCAYNADITDIFRNKYLSPRSPYTTLQIPIQGIGEWCHPKDSANIDDSALRSASGVISLNDIPFNTPSSGHNVVYVSKFDNYPTSASLPLTGKAKALNLLLAGSSNHMQCYMENARIEVFYEDGSSETLPLIPPYNWCPIEQDYYVDGKAFNIPTIKPYRLSLKGGVVSDNLGKALGIPDDEVYGRRIDGGAALMLTLPLNPEKQLKDLRLTAIANDIVAGLIAATYIRWN